MEDEFFKENRTMGKHENINMVTDLSYNLFQGKVSMHFRIRSNLK